MYLYYIYSKAIGCKDMTPVSSIEDERNFALPKARFLSSSVEDTCVTSLQQIAYECMQYRITSSKL